MKRRKKIIDLEQMIEREKAMSEPERVIHLAEMGLSVRQIAIEIGRSEKFVRSNYAKEINEGIARGGATVHKVIWEKAISGDHSCLSYLMYTLNNEQYYPLPKLVKDVIADERARSRPAGYRPQTRERERDTNGRFKSSEFESSEFRSEFEAEPKSDFEPES